MLQAFLHLFFQGKEPKSGALPFDMQKIQVFVEHVAELKFIHSQNRVNNNWTVQSQYRRFLAENKDWKNPWKYIYTKLKHNISGAPKEKQGSRNFTVN